MADGFRTQHQSLDDRGVGQPFGDQCQDLALAFGAFWEERPGSRQHWIADW
jgi:hypothetical protein